MADRPIIFSAPMVQALLAGRKTQTRRLIKRGPLRVWLDTGFTLGFINDPGNAAVLPYQRGDRLWVREAWTTRQGLDDTAPRDISPKQSVGYLANTDEGPWLGRPRPSIHMPRWASRLTLTVTDVRVQKARDISDTDALAEGVRWWDEIEGYSVNDDGSFFHGGNAGEAWWQFFSYLHRPKSSTGDITDYFAGRPAWNPDVVALTFTVAQENIDSTAQSMPITGSRLVPQTAPDCPKPTIKQSLIVRQPIEIQGSDGGRDRD